MLKDMGCLSHFTTVGNVHSLSLSLLLTKIFHFSVVEYSQTTKQLIKQTTDSGHTLTVLSSPLLSPLFPSLSFFHFSPKSVSKVVVVFCSLTIFFIFCFPFSSFISFLSKLPLFFSFLLLPIFLFASFFWSLSNLLTMVIKVLL